MRLLVLDQSLILQWLVRHEFPDGVEILSAQDLHQAEELLAAETPDAAVVSLPPAQIPWREFQHRCASHSPPIPVLYETCLDIDARAIGLDPADQLQGFAKHRRLRHHAFGPEDAAIALPPLSIPGQAGGNGADPAMQGMGNRGTVGVIVIVGRNSFRPKDMVQPAGHQKPGK